MPQATSSVRAGGSASIASYEPVELLLPARPLAVCIQTGSEVPVVEFRSARVVVRLHATSVVTEVRDGLGCAPPRARSAALLLFLFLTSRAGLRGAAAPAPCPPGRSARRTAIGTRRCRLSSCLMHPTHEIVRQVSSPVLCLLGDVPCLTSQGAAGAQQVHSRSRRRHQEPARPDASLPTATSLRGIGDVRESFCEIDQSLGEPIDVSHFRPLLSSNCM